MMGNNRYCYLIHNSADGGLIKNVLLMLFFGFVCLCVVVMPAMAAEGRTLTLTESDQTLTEIITKTLTQTDTEPRTFIETETRTITGTAINGNTAVTAIITETVTESDTITQIDARTITSTGNEGNSSVIESIIKTVTKPDIITKIDKKKGIITETDGSIRVYEDIIETVTSTAPEIITTSNGGTLLIDPKGNTATYLGSDGYNSTQFTAIFGPSFCTFLSSFDGLLSNGSPFNDFQSSGMSGDYVTTDMIYDPAAGSTAKIGTNGTVVTIDNIDITFFTFTVTEPDDTVTEITLETLTVTKPDGTVTRSIAYTDPDGNVTETVVKPDATTSKTIIKTETNYAPDGTVIALSTSTYTETGADSTSDTTHFTIDPSVTPAYFTHTTSSNGTGDSECICTDPDPYENCACIGNDEPFNVFGGDDLDDVFENWKHSLHMP